MIRPHAEGCTLAVRAQPGAKRDAIVGRHGAALKVAVSAPADQGKANEALIALLAQTFGVKRNAVVLLAGSASRDKTFLVRGLAPDAAESILAAT